MFDRLASNLEGIFTRLRHKGSLRESDIDAALREVRAALLEADVALSVAREFVETVRERSRGAERLRGVNPAQQVIKLVHDHLVETLGSETTGLDLAGNPPVAMMLVGLQGSGKTTTTAKIGRWLQEGEGRRKVLMASLDVRRPAAQEQLAVLGEQAGVATLPIVAGEGPLAIARRALKAARRSATDVVLLDTAGRLHIDDELMEELASVRELASPREVLFVADAMTGQDAVNSARPFHESAGVTGIVLTRIDGDARGGAALSMRQVTRCPIKLMGTGEQLDQLEPFHPDRLAGQILGMGDVVSLVEKAARVVEEEDAQKLARKMESGQGFDFDDLRLQISHLRRMGGMQGLLGLLPSVARARREMEASKLDESALGRIEAILSSMTPAERRDPRIIHASRKKRIAAGSGTRIQDVNRVMKMHAQMNGSMKKVRRMAKRGQLPPGFELPQSGDPLSGIDMPGGLKFP